MKSVFVFSHSKQIKWYAVFMKAIKASLEDANIILFVHGEDDRLYAEQFNIYDEVIDLIEDFNYDSSLTLDELEVSQEIINLESDLGISFFWEDMKVDRWIRAKNDTEFSVQYLNHAFTVFNQLYEDFRPVFGFGESTMAIYRFAHHIFDRDGLPYIGPMSNRYTDRFHFEENWYWSWDRCLKYYNDYLENGIPENIKDHTEELYQELAVRGTKPVAFENFKKSNQPGYVTFRKENILRIFQILNSLRGLKSDYFKNNIRYSIIENSFFKKVIRVLKNYYDHFSYLKFVKEEIIDGQPYGIYFLHYQPEYTVDSLGKFYHDQVNLISNIASSLPAGQILYVKEHPGMVGLRNKEYYKDITRHSNVILLHHNIDSLELIRGAKIVFSIVGTVGLEATFNNVPAIMFGQYAFSNIGTCNFCDNLWELNKLIRQKTKRINHESAKKMSKALLAAKYTGSYPGKIPISDETIDPFYEDESQHVLVENAVRLELENRKIISN
ncbi:hypothetical protein OAK61_01680 [Gammaproteobacteria bacterium]|nr:hypothetical protein [Gammaproteobacteria bacterium]